MPKLFYDGLIGIEVVNSTNVQISGFQISAKQVNSSEINGTTIFLIKNSKKKQSKSAQEILLIADPPVAT